jgi:4-hydroxy-3-polyprenylbenzoate decarboxylase
MPYKDLREFIARLEMEGELKRVKAEVDWNLEIGAIARRAMELKKPALLFEKVKNFSSDYQVLSSPVGPTTPQVHGRLAMAMDLPKDISTASLVEEFALRSRKRIKPKLVSTAPCKENISDKIDLTKFPAPIIHGVDAGKYIGTWHIDVVKDPDTGWVNWGVYRHMVYDEKTIGWFCYEIQHGPTIFYNKYEARGKPMPIAIAIGTEPVSTIISASGVPAQVDEADVAGGIRGEPVELVKCETVDLEVPASAEIVLEGMVYPGERREEGGFGEFTGYDAGGRLQRPVIHLTCVTHRDNPILTMTNVGKPWDDATIIYSISHSALIINDLRERGVPFKSLYLPPPCLAVIVSASSIFPGYAHTLASAVWSSKPAMNRPYIIVVDEDVDVTNWEEVFWCLTTRMHPQRGIHTITGAPVITLAPFLNRQEREETIAARTLFDATFPGYWSKEERPTVIDFEHAWPADVREKVLSRWPEYGID